MKDYPDRMTAEEARKFGEDVLNIVAQIPHGQVTTYGYIAALAGWPSHSRMVGRTLRYTPGAEKQPCYRVVNKDGRTAPGWSQQRALLEAEGVVFKSNGHVDMQRHLWKPSCFFVPVFLKEKEKLGHEIDIVKMKIELDRLTGKIDETKVKKKRSNYYENASKCEKLEKITISLTDDNKQDFISYDDVYAKDFIKYIMVTDELKPEHDESANIELVSPVLKRSKCQWMGIYRDEVIQFSMKSDEFKSLVLSGQVAFNNGSSILCHLVIKKKVNSQGEVKITGYDVMEVDQYFINDTPIETPEGKKRRKDREAAKNQLELFDEKDFD